MLSRPTLLAAAAAFVGVAWLTAALLPVFTVAPLARAARAVAITWAACARVCPPRVAPDVSVGMGVFLVTPGVGARLAQTLIVPPAVVLAGGNYCPSGG